MHIGYNSDQKVPRNFKKLINKYKDDSTKKKEIEMLLEISRTLLYTNNTKIKRNTVCK